MLIQSATTQGAAMIFTFLLLATTPSNFDTAKASSTILGLQDHLSARLKGPDAHTSETKEFATKLTKMTFLGWSLCVTKKSEEFASLNEPMGDLADAAMGACSDFENKMLVSVQLAGEADELDITVEQAKEFLESHKKALRQEALGKVASTKSGSK